MRHDGIDAILGCSVAAVKVRIHRARLQLKSACKHWRANIENVDSRCMDLWPLYVFGETSADFGAWQACYGRDWTVEKVQLTYSSLSMMSGSARMARRAGT